MPFDNGPGSEVDGDVRSHRRHVERVDAGAAAALVTEVDVVAVTDFRHDQVVAGAAEYRIVARSGIDQVVALIAEDAVRSGIAVDDVVCPPRRTPGRRLLRRRSRPGRCRR